MKFKVKSKVVVDGIGQVTDEHIQEFKDDSNVFGRMLEYHRYMNRTFPGCRYELVEAKEVE